MRSRHIDEERLEALLSEPKPYKFDEDGEPAFLISHPSDDAYAIVDLDDLYYVDSAYDYDTLAPRVH